MSWIKINRNYVFIFLYLFNFTIGIYGGETFGRYSDFFFLSETK